MDATMMAGFGLLRVARHLGDGWDLAGSGLGVLLDEMRWGNRYFLKMQDKDGRVWADTAGGVNGDNSDNHWTDNRAGTDDDRYINPAKPAMVQAMFVALQAMVAQAFAERDADYANSCLAAGRRCWEVTEPPKLTRDLSWRVLAALELHGATRDARYAAEAATLGRSLMASQVTEFIGSQKMVRGFWSTNETRTTPYVEPVYSALPPYRLLGVGDAFPSHADVSRWRHAVQLYLDEYVSPMSRPFRLWHPAARYLYRVADRGNVPSVGWRADVPLLHADAAAVVVVGRDVTSRIARSPAGRRRESVWQAGVPRPGASKTGMGDGQQPVWRVANDRRGVAQLVPVLALRRAADRRDRERRRG